MRLTIALVAALLLAIAHCPAQELALDNPGFEEIDAATADRDAGPLPVAWQARTVTFGAHRLTEEGRSGAHAAQIHFAEGSGADISGYFYSEPQPLPPCSEVTVSAWANVMVPAEQRGAHRGAYIRLMFQRDGAYVGLLDSAAVGDTGGDWRQLRLSGAPPPEADSWRMSVEFNGIGTALFDDCTAAMTPLETLPAAGLDAPTGQILALGDGRVGVLGPPRAAAGDLQAVTTVIGRSALPPTIHIGAVYYTEDGTQLGVDTTTGRAWRRRTELSLRLRALPGAATVRPIVCADSREAWQAAEVEPPQIAPGEEVPVLAPSDVQMAGHPRLLISPEHLERLRALAAMDRDELAARHPGFARQLEALLADADRCLDEQEIVVYSGRYSTTLPPAVPRRHEDNFPYWTGLSREIEYRMEKLATAYLLTGERRYADRCTQWALALCEWPQWTDPDYGGYNACLDTGHFCHAVAFAYDFLYDVLTQVQRETIRNALLEKGAAAVMRDATEGWAQTMGWPNGFAVVMGGMGIAGAATLGDDPRARGCVEYSRGRLHEFLDTRDRDGGYIEGHTYGGYAMSYIMPFAGTLATHGDEALASHPYLAKTLRFAACCLDPISATSVNFCDSSYSARDYRSTAAWLARMGDPLAYWYLTHNHGLAELFGYVPPTALLWHPLDGSGAAPEGWPPGAHYRDIGWIVARTGFADEVTSGEPSLLFAMRSGRFGSHCQADANSFMLNVNGRWLLRDPGYGRGATAEHSTLLVGGQGQSRADAQIAAFGNVGRIVYAVGDASACYERLSDFRRHAVMVAGEYVVLLDEIAFAGRPEPIASQLITDVVAPRIEPGRIGLIPAEEDAVAGEQCCTVLLPDATPVSVEDYGGRAKVVCRRDAGDLCPLVLWPRAQPPERVAFAVEDECALTIIETGGATDVIAINLSGDSRTITAGDGPAITTDARLVWVRLRAGAVSDLSMVWGSRLRVGDRVVVQEDAKQDLWR